MAGGSWDPTSVTARRQSLGILWLGCGVCVWVGEGSGDREWGTCQTYCQVAIVFEVPSSLARSFHFLLVPSSLQEP